MGGAHHPVDELPGDEGSCAVLDGRQLALITQGVHAQGDGLLAAASSGHHGGDLVKAGGQTGNGQDQVGTGDDDDFRDGIAGLERPDGVDDHGLAAELRHDLVDAAHAAGGACGHDDRAAAAQGQQLPGGLGKLGNVHILQLLYQFFEEFAANHEVLELIKGGAGGAEQHHIAILCGGSGGVYGFGEIVDDENLGLALGIVGAVYNCIVDLLGGGAGEVELPDMLADLGAEHIEGDVLVIAAGDEDDLLREAAQAGDGAAGGGGDGIVVEPDAVLDAHQLDAVLHAAEGGGHMADGLVGHQAVSDGDGGHVVLHIVDAGEQDGLHGHDFLRNAVIHPVNYAVFQIGAVFRADPAGEVMGLAVAQQGRGDGIVGVDHQQAGAVLELVDVLLGLDVLVHVLVDIQVVGGQIGDDGALGAALHVHELEGAELHHGEILLLHFGEERKQGRADVAAQPDLLALGLQKLGDQGGGGGFSVGAGDGDGVAAAQLEEDLHLRGDLRALCPQKLDGGVAGVHTGGTEDHICLDAVEIALAQAQDAAVFLQLEDFVLQFFPGSAVAAGDLAAEGKEQTNQRAVADAQTQHGDLLAPQGFKIMVKCRKHVNNLQYVKSKCRAGACSRRSFAAQNCPADRQVWIE